MWATWNFRNLPACLFFNKATEQWLSVLYAIHFAAFITQYLKNLCIHYNIKNGCQTTVTINNLVARVPSPGLQSALFSLINSLLWWKAPQIQSNSLILCKIFFTNTKSDFVPIFLVIADSRLPPPLPPSPRHGTNPLSGTKYICRRPLTQWEACIIHNNSIYLFKQFLQVYCTIFL